MVQLAVNTDKGKQARVGERLAGPVPAEPLYSRLYADKAVGCIYYPAGVMEFISHADRMKKVNAVDSGND